MPEMMIGSAVAVGVAVGVVVRVGDAVGVLTAVDVKVVTGVRVTIAVAVGLDVADASCFEAEVGPPTVLEHPHSSTPMRAKPSIWRDMLLVPSARLLAV